MSECFTAGSMSKGDCKACYRPSTDRFEISASSVTGRLFLRAIMEAATREASRFSAPPSISPSGNFGGRLEISDAGALDYVIESRIEAVLEAAGLVRRRSPGILDIASLIPSGRNRPRRSRLYVPGNQPDFQVNAGLFGADTIVLDLEDSVEEDRKEEARILIVRLLTDARSLLGSAEIAVRINPLNSRWGKADLKAVIQAIPQVLVLPKCENETQVAAYDDEVSRLENESGIEEGFIRFIPLVETANGVIRSAEIARASKRNVALGFGAEDLRAELGLARTDGEEELAVVRSLVVLAAHAAGVHALDSVYSAIDDKNGLESSARRARESGFSGKGLIHPGQIAIVNSAFAPNLAEVAWARNVVAAMKAAEAEGRGAATYEGMMLDAPLLARAKRILAANGGNVQDEY